jgi:uncharacterized protein
MSAVKVEKQLHVSATPDSVWRTLIDPEAVVCCLPGAALVESSEDGLRHTGTVSVSLGPLGLTYRGTADFVQVDHATRTLEIKARGRETTGPGTVSMSLTATVSPEGTGSRVELSASMQLAGRIVALGRGMIDVVMEETLLVFAACLTRKLDTPAAEPNTAERVEAVIAVEPANPGAVGVLFRALRTWIGRRFGRR